ncbi:DUF3276 family protein [Bacteroides sp. 519]|uniref:DUF3276 family protein n=1 Tax=Bacteroides sp. 519 TaxID=2302937 RepID=UPI0013CF4925|nr:DUF3276 family protein [Bacteroides sp. 519]NDV57095.1 DUF3276 family protein [Bacteroides sp. 519]
MEDFKKKNGIDAADKEIVFSKSIKAGKRIYYLDVKKNRKDELFLAITESKKIVSGEGETSQVSFEKHKIFLYKEDFEKFVNGLNETIAFISEKQPMSNDFREKEQEALAVALAGVESESVLKNEIDIDIDFE